MKSDVTKNQAVRLLARQSGTNCPIVTVPGAQWPRLMGESYYFTNKSGQIIRHPSGYGYPMEYHASTRRIEVGEDWRPPVMRHTDHHGVTAYVLCGYRQRIHGCYADAGIAAHNHRIWLVTLPDGRKYHANRRVKLRKVLMRDKSVRGDAHTAIRTALHNTRKQEKADRQWERQLDRDLRDIYVTRDHARAAGACPAGIDSFVRRHNIRDDAIPADQLLAIGDQSSYIRRAITIASTG